MPRWCCTSQAHLCWDAACVDSCYTHHITVDLISQDGDTVSGGHWTKEEWNCLRDVVFVCLQNWNSSPLWAQECSQPLRISCRCFLLKTEPHGLDGLVMIRQEVLSSIRLSMCCRSTSHDFSGCENNHNTYLCTDECLLPLLYLYIIFMPLLL